MDTERSSDPHYIAYGLRIASDMALPGLQTAPAEGVAADLRIEFHARPAQAIEPIEWVLQLEPESGKPWLCCARLPTGYLLRYRGIADVVVDLDARHVTCAPRDGYDDENALRHVALDQVMPLILKLRGHEALHATAVRTRRGICAFIGPSGSGKSTLAASFLKAGYAVISDDCLLLSYRGHSIHAVPAYPGVRLWADAYAALRDEDDSPFPAPAPTAKVRWAPRSAVAGFSRDALPLTRIYRLMPFRDPPRINGTVTAIRRVDVLSGRAAFMELVGSTFRFDAWNRGMLTREVEMWAHVVRTVPMRRLWLEDDLSSTRTQEAVLVDLGLA